MRKQRTALYRPINKWLESNRKNNKNHICEYYRIYEHKDGTITGCASECDYPWWRQCDGNKFKCCKLKYHHLATRKNNNIEPDFYDADYYKIIRH